MCYLIIIFQKIIHSSPIQNNDNSIIKDGGNDFTYLPIGVYYEALCPDSRNFILQHLVPSFDKAPNSFDIDFVPYGKAKVTNKQYFFYKVNYMFN